MNSMSCDFNIHSLISLNPIMLCVRFVWGTHVKISQLVTSLQTSCQQAVFALLVPSCQQVVPNLLTTCNRLDENIRLVTRLF